MKALTPCALAARTLLAGTALATLGAPALADFKFNSGANELILSGNLNAQVETLTTSDTTVPANRPPSRSRLNQNSSELRFTFNRNLGDGLQGFGTVGTEIQSFSGGNANNTSTFGFRNTGVGLRGGFGEVAVGRWDSHYHMNFLASIDSAYLTGPMAWSTQSLWGFVNSSELIGNRFANTVRYATPNYKGFTGHAIVSRGDGAVSNVPATGISNARDLSTNLAVVYRDGPIGAFASLYQRDDFVMNLPFAAAPTPSLSEQTSARAGAKYTFGNGLSLGVIWDNSEQTHKVSGGAAAFAGGRSAKRTVWAFPVEYATGKHRINFNYAKAGDTSGNLFLSSPIGTNANTGATFLNLGYKYWIDDNTNFHVGWSRMNNKANGAYDLFLNGGVAGAPDLRGVGAARGTKVQSIQVGMLFRF